LWDLAAASNVPTRLADLHGHDGLVQRDDLPGAAHAASEEITVNPRPVSEADLLGILERAYEGVRP
jgi:alcohol dehydrogenase class IV